jgi:hypothetical protein
MHITLRMQDSCGNVLLQMAVLMLQMAVLMASSVLIFDLFFSKTWAPGRATTCLVAFARIACI